MTQQNVRRALAILGCIYVLVIFTRTLWRHWIIAGWITGIKPVAAPEGAQGPASETEEVDAQHSTASI